VRPDEHREPLASLLGLTVELRLEPEFLVVAWTREEMREGRITLT
jgi:hypothetical protein